MEDVAMAYSVPTAQLALQLSALAYIDENTNASQQQMIDGINAGLQTAGYSDWRVAWGPALDQDRGNMMYAAANTAGDQIAVSVRGTDWSFWLDWVEDFDNFLPLTPYSSFGVPVGPNVKIAQGTGNGLAILLALNDGTSDLRSFITTKAQTAQVMVTGHSLGGCLAAASSSGIKPDCRLFRSSGFPRTAPAIDRGVLSALPCRPHLQG
jgi:hypothetical protein